MLPLSPIQGGSETPLRWFANKTDILSTKLLQSFSALKLSDKALILRTMLIWGAQSAIL